MASVREALNRQAEGGFVEGVGVGFQCPGGEAFVQWIRYDDGTLGFVEVKVPDAASPDVAAQLAERGFMPHRDAELGQLGIMLNEGQEPLRGLCTDEELVTALTSLIAMLGPVGHATFEAYP